jgi:Tfp pilus assembly major pilin PilA
MQVFTDKQMDLVIGKLLRSGVIFSGVLVSFGGLLYLQHPLRSARNYTHFLAESTSLQGIAGVLRGAVHLDANSVNYRKRVLHKLARDLELPKLTFQVIRRTIATLAQKKGTVKDVQGLMRHSRTATTTDVYMQTIPESVQSTINSIHLELRKSTEKERRKVVKPLPDAVVFGGKPLKRRAVSVKVFGNLTPNDTKLGRKSLASC